MLYFTHYQYTHMYICENTGVCVHKYLQNGYKQQKKGERLYCSHSLCLIPFPLFFLLQIAAETPLNQTINPYGSSLFTVSWG